MTRLLRAAQMRAIEGAAIESGRATGLELMERAGQGVVQAVFAHWPELAAAPHRAVVVCGPGNNGGDGFVIARLLAQWGWQVEVYLYGNADALPPDAAVNYRRWLDLGPVGDLRDAPRAGQGADLFVDALFGTGLTRPLKGAARDWAAARGARTVSVDLPSGLCSDSGKPLADAAIVAELTVTFHQEKLGHHLGAGPHHCGRVVIADIGLEADDTGVPLVGPPDPGIVAKAADAHKYDHGHALVLTGPMGRTGAARLAARAALRIGAGAVTLGAPPSAMMELACQIEALMLRRVADGAALEHLLADTRLNALCIGPGLGTEAAQAELVRVALQSGRPCVLDADALTLIAADRGLFKQLHGGCVLTPHGGEFGRLFPNIAARLAADAETGPAYSRLDATLEAAQRAGCVVLLKGPDTVIATPDGQCAVLSNQYERAVPWLATAGAGDVLAGLITGAVARGLAPLEATKTAAWLHAECARQIGPGLIASDLPDAVPAVLRGLLAQTHL